MMNKEKLLKAYTDENGVIDWCEISKHQKLSKNFIREHEDEVD